MGQQKPSLWQVICSAFAAAFGVQSEKNRQRDFEQGKPGDYLVVGIVVTVLLIVAIFLVVKAVIANV